MVAVVVGLGAANGSVHKRGGRVGNANAVMNYHSNFFSVPIHHERSLIFPHWVITNAIECYI